MPTARRKMTRFSSFGPRTRSPAGSPQAISMSALTTASGTGVGGVVGARAGLKVGGNGGVGVDGLGIVVSSPCTFPVVVVAAPGSDDDPLLVVSGRWFSWKEDEESDGGATVVDMELKPGVPGSVSSGDISLLTVPCGLDILNP